MITLSDLVTLAKAGYGPKQVKELMEVFQTDPKVKDEKIESDDKGTPEIKKEDPKPAENKEDSKPAEGGNTDDIAELIKLIKED